MFVIRGRICLTLGVLLEQGAWLLLGLAGRNGGCAGARMGIATTLLVCYSHHVLRLLPSSSCFHCLVG